MNLSYQSTVDLNKSAELTFSNMRKYYEHFSVDWNKSAILEQIMGLDNWDIIQGGKMVGALRLSIDVKECWLRDLQVEKQFQNLGVGTYALEEAKVKAIQAGAELIKLRVFKMSPAHKLYKRVGFQVNEEDEKFYYMDKKIS